MGVDWFHEDNFLGFTGTHPGFIRPKGGQPRGNRRALPGFPGHGKEAAPTAPPHGGHCPPAPVFRSQAAHRGLAAAADADFAGKEAGPDLGGIAPSHAAGLYLACHPLRSGEDGADI